MTRRLAVARLWCATNSFAPVVAGRPDAELKALHDFAAAWPDWQVTVLRCASAAAPGPLDDDFFTAFYDEVLRGIAGGRWDAVFLSLHGACLTTRRVRPELGLIAAIKSEIGDTPLGASFALQANIAPEAARHLAFASGCRTAAPVDGRATALRVLDRLATVAEGRLHPVGAAVKADVLLPGFNLQTDTGPMAEVQALTRELERRPVLDVSAFAGFPYADAPDTGAAAMAFADGDAAAARKAAAAVAAALRTRGRAFDAPLPSPAEGIARALSGPPGLVCVADPADSPDAGGLGDTPGVFRALVEARPAVPTAFAFFGDPPLVARARNAGIGAVLDVELGGRVHAGFGPPVGARATVVRLTDGRYVTEGPPEAGVAVDLGGSVVLDVEGIAVVASAAGHAPDDPAYFALHGIDLERTRLLCVKAADRFRAAFAGRAALIVDVDAPGPVGRDLSLLPYRRVPPDLRPARP